MTQNKCRVRYRAVSLKDLLAVNCSKDQGCMAWEPRVSPALASLCPSVPSCPAMVQLVLEPRSWVGLGLGSSQSGPLLELWS